MKARAVFLLTFLIAIPSWPTLESNAAELFSLSAGKPGWERTEDKRTEDNYAAEPPPEWLPKWMSTAGQVSRSLLMKVPLSAGRWWRVRVRAPPGMTLRRPEVNNRRDSVEVRGTAGTLAVLFAVEQADTWEKFTAEAAGYDADEDLSVYPVATERYAGLELRDRDGSVKAALHAAPVSPRHELALEAMEVVEQVGRPTTMALRLVRRPPTMLAQQNRMQ